MPSCHVIIKYFNIDINNSYRQLASKGRTGDELGQELIDENELARTFDEHLINSFTISQAIEYLLLYTVDEIRMLQ